MAELLRPELPVVAVPPDRCGNRGLAVAAASRPSLEATSNLFSSVREPSTSTSSSSSSFSCLTEAVAVGGSEVAATDAGIEADVGVALVGELFSVAIMATKV